MRGYEQKLDRALDHLYAVEAAVGKFMQRQPRAVVVESDLKTHKQVMTFRVFEDPPSEITGMAADCFHNLRHALDHIAYGLAIRISGCDPPPNEENIYFPIAKTSASFRGSVRR